MRYMLIMQAPESMRIGEADAPPADEAFEAMGRYNTELVDAGVLLAAEGLAPSAEGFVVTREDADASVTDGPFTEAKELIAGFWILEVASREEAVQWATRCPIGPGVRLEVRRIPEMAEFEGVAPAEVLDAEATLRRRIAERQQA
ncbi:MAG TPA: YciI family protein [Actinomycetospora sp.]|nr:YciI family protein [Actinomycetospora sp.]